MIIGCRPSNKGAVGNYRLIQPLMRVHTDQSDDHAAILHHNINQAQFEALSGTTDVFVYQYPQTEAEAKHIEFMSEDPNVLTVVEIDDTVWNMDARQERYAVFGTREVKVNGQWLYKDGENGFDLKGNTQRMKYLTRCIMACDLVTVTTPELKKLMEKNLQEAKKKKIWVEVLPNCVDLDFYQPVELKKDKLRIIWQGGDGHRHDLMTVADALKEVLEKHENVELVFAAHSWPEVANKIKNFSRVSFDPAWTSFDAHPYRLKLLGGDIAICPLEDNEFNRAKSEIKYTEYAALGIPTVASDFIVYSSVIENGKNGFLAKTKEDWVKHLSALIESAELREKIGSAGRKWVQENRSLDKNYHLWADTYKKYLDIKT